MGKKKSKLELSAVLTVLGVILLFSVAIGVTLIAPEYVDPSWKEASSSYQVQMYEISDPNVYVATEAPKGARLSYVNHLQQGLTLLAFQESDSLHIVSPPNLEKYISKKEDPVLKLTSRVLLLRKPKGEIVELASQLQKKLQDAWRKKNTEGTLPYFQIVELYDPNKSEAFALSETDGITENWIDDQFFLLDPTNRFIEDGVVFVKNPKEYRTKPVNVLGNVFHVYDENGEPVQDLEELKTGATRFLSRKELVEMGEDIYRIEGCWYCHTDQTRTLVQDTVLNGSTSFPAPPSSANEYIYQRVTFPGTRRIGPDLSRVGVKRPHRDWHMSHFWDPRTESKGSIMPSFKHFFDNDPAGARASLSSVPNVHFEAIFQYLMTKGTRITPPTQAWWLGLDPIQTIDIIEGRDADA